MHVPVASPGMSIPQTPTCHHLQIGECALSMKPLVISTVLGSCVGVTFFHPGRSCGAMLHALLPRRPAAVNPETRPAPCRFVDSAIDTLLSRFVQRRIDPEELVIKLFGGAGTFTRVEENSKLDVGLQNIAAAETILAEKGLRIAARDVGGLLGRKILFHVHTGEVWLYRLGNRFQQT